MPAWWAAIVIFPDERISFSRSSRTSVVEGSPSRRNRHWGAISILIIPLRGSNQPRHICKVIHISFNQLCPMVHNPGLYSCPKYHISSRSQSSLSAPSGNPGILGRERYVFYFILEDAMNQFTAGKHHDLLIDGKRVPAASGRYFETRDPSTEEVIGLVA